MEPVSVVVSMRNSATTIAACLEGLAMQQYPIAEIIVFDNGSTDDSVAIAEEIVARWPSLVRIIRRDSNGALATSYNDGAEMAVADLVVFCHSDGAFPSNGELEKLTEPLRRDPSVIAVYPNILTPREIWNRFSFWQKSLFARRVELIDPSMCGKFDCIRKSVYLAVGGLNMARFTATCGYGGEDSDLNFRLAKAGRVVASEACVIHVHGLSASFGLKDLFSARKLFARTYGKILMFQGINPASRGTLLFFVRPTLAALPFLCPPWTLLAGVMMQLLFSLATSWNMYTSRNTLLNRRILLLPFVDVALIYYETFWFLEGLVTRSADARDERVPCP